jgi:4-aminobutyrate--pyruvate transaminase
VATAVALETLKIYEERDILGHVQSVAPLFQERLRDLGEHPLVGNARGRGMIGTLELVRNKATREAFKPTDGVAIQAGKRAQAHGVITRALGDNFSFCPPLIMTETEINEMFDRSQVAIDETYGWAKTCGLI